ncbi:type II toxin-antitoxin system RelE/ParE family toxin [Bradyrhizobium sp. Ai1a-2]|uniref:type II toxin-antitoxin system RelE/ParE family toxin n=1 Tax=Bradyrhizobium sp. Ai1a-2 TaxID=196490 RepID=UPI000483B204|nr:type II toxin-antitoxin system RelE/ParE family toxin [Bradyrhizobium sp. Ai1a-2]
MHGVIETEDFLRDAADVGMSAEERALIVNALSEDPMLGSPMVGTGGARKVRFPIPGKGKSGGYRVVHYYGGKDIPVFMLAVFKKNEKDNLTNAERNELKKELAGLAEDYLRSVKRKAAELRRRAR